MAIDFFNEPKVRKKGTTKYKLHHQTLHFNQPIELQ
jgi:hypothetical protein